MPAAVRAASAAAGALSQREPRRGGTAWGWVLSVGLIVAISRALFAGYEKPAPTPHAYIPSPAPARSAGVQPPARASAAPEPARTAHSLSYRGVAVTAAPEGEEAWRYTARELGLQTRTRRGMHLAINSVLFRRATGIAVRGAGAEVRRGGRGPRRIPLLGRAGSVPERAGRRVPLPVQRDRPAPRRVAGPGRRGLRGLGPDELRAAALLGWTAYVGSFAAPPAAGRRTLCAWRAAGSTPRATRTSA